MRLYRLGTALHPVWDGAGAGLHGGRWNPVGAPVIYAAGSLALAMLERLAQRRNLGGTLLAEAEVPDDLAVDDLLAAPPPGWRVLGSPEAAAAVPALIGMLDHKEPSIAAAAVEALPANQRAVISLRDVEGWNSEEVRNALDISEVNQRVLLHRARSRVRSALEEYLA